MSSPFPGMDPYLEGYLWPDVHQRLAGVIADLISPQIVPDYVVRLSMYTVADTDPEEDVGIMYPDVEVMRKKSRTKEPEPVYTAPPVLTDPSISIPSLGPLEVRIPVIEIRDRKGNNLITAIEVLSPVNKRKPGLEPYREKRHRLHEAGVHLLEIDLIRRGERPFVHPMVPHAHYLALLTRAGVGKTDVWAFNLQDSLPVLPVPLKAPDPDARLDLGAALRTIYERGRYDLSINYEEAPPPPELTEAPS
ncbi:MAG: DUF4058 family protein [Saprospirales bacterium]|nr:DUF4058 family protein [Saprospirales bacterium]MBK8489720.1 DUF4058 family protein [Saprospirales bacterium]